ncbi:MAG: hypothetical protein IJB98_03605, partial [Clostridia bacterium]|nr:hypothetical protein [Clostridia bacterium]
MSIFTKILAWCGGILITSTAVVTPCYYCIPEFKDAVNKNVLKIEQTTEDTSEKDEKINELTLKLEEKTLAHEVLSADLLEEKEKVAELELSAQQDADTIATLQSSLTEKSNALNTALEEKDTLMLEIETLETEKNNLFSQIEGLNSVIENNESEIAQLEGENASLKEQKQILEDDLLSNATQISELNSRIETNNARIEELENENSSKQSQIDNLAESIETLEDEKVLLEGQVEEKDAEIMDLQGQITTLTEERNSALESLSSTQLELEELQSVVSTLESDLAVKEVEIASLNEQIESYKNALNRDESKVYIEDIVDSGKFSGTKISSYEYLVSSQSSSHSGIYLFNSIDYSLLKLYESGFWGEYSYVFSNGDSVLSSSSYGFIYFCYETKSFVVINSSGSGAIVALELKNGNRVISQRGEVVLLNGNEKTSLMRDSGYWNYISELSNGNLVLGGSSVSGARHINILTNEVVNLTTSIAGYKVLFEMIDGSFIIGNSSPPSYKMLAYDGESLTQTNIGNYSSDSMVMLCESDNKLYMSDTGSRIGIIVYDSVSNIVENPYIYERWTNAKVLSNGDILFTSNSTMDKYILVYRKSTNTFYKG